MSALRGIPRHCGVRTVRLLPRDCSFPLESCREASPYGWLSISSSLANPVRFRGLQALISNDLRNRRQS